MHNEVTKGIKIVKCQKKISTKKSHTTLAGEYGEHCRVERLLETRSVTLDKRKAGSEKVKKRFNGQ